MSKQAFKVKFHSDIILNSSSVTTTGTADTLDYIAGSNFLGIVASNGGYESFGEKAFDVFHGGKVRFGDGHIFKETESLKLPFCYFINKGEKLVDTKLYYHHLLSKQERGELKEKGIQLKQIRDGYFNQNGEILELDYNYTQKSAYDKDKKRSKNQAMFGYKAINRGSEFVFEVSFADESLKEEITKKLLGFKKLGKSKNSQYGKIEIVKFDIQTTIKQKQIENNCMLLYAKSNLALIDENGNPLSSPTIKSLKLQSDCEIDFEKSQIRTRTYSAYNSMRCTRDYEKVIIEKGSVIAIKVPNNFNTKEYEIVLSKGVGNYLSEGFGEILLNPEFLYNISFSKLEKDKAKNILGLDIKDIYNTDLSGYLQQKLVQKELDKAMIKEAFENRDKFNGTTTSQWGQIRSLASLFNDDEIIKELYDYLNNGVAKEKWKNNYTKLENLINKQSQKARFTKLLAIEVSKYLKQ